MATTIKNSDKKGILLTALLLSLTVCAKAQTSSNFFSKVYDNLIKDSGASIFIIASVIGVGLLAFIINKMVNKDEKDDKNTVHPTSHRHHHHHRVVKKSA